MAEGTTGNGPSRRLVLLGGAATVVTAIAACDLRVGSPPKSSSPTPPPPPTRDALEDVVERLRTLASTASTLRQPPEPSRGPTGSSPAHSTASSASATPTETISFGRQLTRLHRQQARRLEAAIPAPSRTPTATAGGGAATGRHTPQGPVTTHELGVQERRGANRAAVRTLTTVDDERLPVLACLAAFQAAAALRLGAAPHWSARDLPGPTVARTLLTSVRPCVYALEEIAARTPLQHRDEVTASLTVMYAARADLVSAAGDSITPPPPAYRLPVRPDDAETRRRLARTMVTRVVRAAASQAPHSADSVSALRFVVRLWGESVRETWRWGAEPEPFPGLRG